MTQARMIRLNAVPDTPTIPGVREMEVKDVLQTASLFTRYMRRFGLAPIFDVEEIKHYFLSGKGEGNIGDGGPGRRKGQVTWSFVVEVSYFQVYPHRVSNWKFPLGPRDTSNYRFLLLLLTSFYRHRQPKTSHSRSGLPILLCDNCCLRA